MIALQLHHRLIENKDWATLIIVLSLVFIAIAKSAFESRFNDFIKLIVSNKYNKIYRESSHLMSGFNVLLLMVNLISFSFFIQLIFFHLGIGEKADWILFTRIFTLLTVFILSKFLIEKIIATVFGIEEVIEQFNLQKVTYRTYIGLLLLPLTIILYYSNNIANAIIYSIIIVLLTINLLTYFISLKIYQNFIFSKFFYFILYLCALEIAPYYFIYYLITKK
jgi:hypothetical protein